MSNNLLESKFTQEVSEVFPRVVKLYDGVIYDTSRCEFILERESTCSGQIYRNRLYKGVSGQFFEIDFRLVQKTWSYYQLELITPSKAKEYYFNEDTSLSRWFELFGEEINYA